MNTDLKSCSARNDAKIEALMATLPTNHIDILGVAASAVRDLHTAVLAGDVLGCEAADDVYQSCIWKMNNGTSFGCFGEADAAGNLLEQHCAAVPGLVPMWGQRGEFLIVVDGIRVIVEFEAGFGRLHYLMAFHVVDLSGAFVSDTGYRAHYENARAGMTVDAVASSAFRAYLEAKKGRVFLRPERRDALSSNGLPEWVCDIQPAADRSPFTLPTGYALVDVVLPAWQAFQVKKWDAATRVALAARFQKTKTDSIDRTYPVSRKQKNAAAYEEFKSNSGALHDPSGRIVVKHRYQIAWVHHDCFKHEVGTIVVVDRFASNAQVWVHKDKPITHRRNKAGKSVVDVDPKCVQTLYHIDQLEAVEIQPARGLNAE